MTKVPVAHHCGHRQRLKDRFVLHPESVPDYELIELLLFWFYPRRDVKAMAKDILQHHGSLHRLVHDPLDTCCPPSLKTGLVLIRECVRRILLYDISHGPLLNNSQRVVAYCHAVMAQNDSEQFRLFFLDKKYHLILDEAHTTGTLDQVALYPREVLKKALSLNAASIIMVHNHPSGDPTPSRADHEITQQLKHSLLPFGIRLLDHFVVAKRGYFSFREQGCLEA
jgi:DNA repair protein RadC